MVLLKSVPELIGSLEDLASKPEIAKLGFTVFTPATIKQEAKRLLDLGMWGILPLFGLKNGKSLGLYPIPGKPLSVWPVVTVFETGDGARSLASNIKSLMPCYVLQKLAFGEHEEDFQEGLPGINEISAFLGGAELMAKVLDGIQDKSLNDQNFKVEGSEVADPGSALTEFFRTFHDLIEIGNNPLLTWQKFTAKWPNFMPGWKMYLKAGIEDSEVHVAALSAAWKIAKSPFLLDNQYTFEELNLANDLNLLPFGLTDDEVDIRTERMAENTWGDEGTVDESIRLVVNDDESEEAPGYEPLLMGALKAMYEDSDYEGRAHLDAFNKLMKAGKYELAYHTSQNAEYMFQFVNEAHLPESYEAGLKAAEAIGDKSLLEVLKLAQ